MKNLLVFSLVLLAFNAPAQRFSTIVLSIKTGNDGLREGNDAWIQFVKKDGTMTAEKNFTEFVSRRGAFEPHKGYTLGVELGATINLQDVSHIVIRHDGSPRALNPLDTYDNWDVEMVKINIKSPDGNRDIYDSSLHNGFLVRFTGEKRTCTISNSRFMPEAFLVDDKSDKIDLQSTNMKPEPPKVVQQSNGVKIQPTSMKPEAPKVPQQSTKIDIKPTMMKPEAPKPAQRNE